LNKISNKKFFKRTSNLKASKGCILTSNKWTIKLDNTKNMKIWSSRILKIYLKINRFHKLRRKLKGNLMKNYSLAADLLFGT
jgi:hypothetical protein